MGQDAKDYEGHFANYAEYSKTFRSWMVAYGIGGPVLLLTNKEAPRVLATSPHLKTIVTLFVLGVSFQIALALINKWAAWHMYRGAYSRYLHQKGDPECDGHHFSKSYGVWRWINKQSWIDLVVDICALLSFSVATWVVLRILLGASKGA